MDENRVEGTARNIGGKVEGAVGNLTGDTKLQADGMVDKVSGKAQQAYGPGRRHGPQRGKPKPRTR